MKKWNGYETTEVMGVKRKLPAGAYKCRIMAAEEKEYGWGSVLLISFDIAEGEYKNFYRAQYEKQTKDKKWKGVYRLTCPTDSGDEKDERLKKAFKTFIHHIESSNEGYKWDWNEASLIGKYFGGIFGEKEYEVDGNSGFYTTIRYTTDVSGLENAQIPKPIMLNRTTQDNVINSTNTSTLDWGSDEALPF